MLYAQQNHQCGLMADWPPRTLWQCTWACPNIREPSPQCPEQKQHTLKRQHTSIIILPFTPSGGCLITPRQTQPPGGFIYPILAWGPKEEKTRKTGPRNEPTKQSTTFWLKPTSGSNKKTESSGFAAPASTMRRWHPVFSTKGARKQLGMATKGPTSREDADGFAWRPGLVLWMHKILHHVETMGGRCLLVFTGESSETRVSERWCRISCIQWGVL